MKNWELEQYLRAVQSDYDYGRDKMNSFRRSYVGKEDDYVFVSCYDTIRMAIEYIERLETKIEELVYAQQIIDEVNRNERRNKAWSLEASKYAAR